MDVRNVINLKPALIVIIALAAAACGRFNSARAAKPPPSPNTARRALAFPRRMPFSPGGLVRVFAVLAVAPLMATACVGNPFAPRDTAAQQKQNAEQMALKWAQCMRDHGVDVPDPTQGGGVRVDGGQAMDQQQMQDAMNACKQYQPKGGNGPGKVDQKALDQLTKYAQCMRDHGIPMQDPQASGTGVQVEANGEGVDPNSDQFHQAQQACQHLMPSQMQQQTGSSSRP